MTRAAGVTFTPARMTARMYLGPYAAAMTGRVESLREYGCFVGGVSPPTGHATVAWRRVVGFQLFRGRTTENGGASRIAV